ncbi:hypothetical protein CC78DRAFT_220170 [Lojkania enalia]|uniref:Uncharacterized protein n=1 Tax=Lojkania enalia TaxID=147567 RepID=A0A9P4KE50_9PLEO|nr:hypothetical protein CC78DRAFT_220170 [Didymosphaeria enalia]
MSDRVARPWRYMSKSAYTHRAASYISMPSTSPLLHSHRQQIILVPGNLFCVYKTPSSTVSSLLQVNSPQGPGINRTISPLECRVSAIPSFSPFLFLHLIFNFHIPSTFLNFAIQTFLYIHILPKMPPNFPPNTYPNLLPSLPANLLSPTTTEHLHHTIRILTRLREHLAERLALSELDDGMRDTRFYIEVVDVLDEVENCRTVTERKGIGRDEGVRRECRQVARPCGVDELGGERRMVGVEIEMGEARNRKVKVELGGESNKTVEVNLDERSNKKVEAQVEVGLGGSDDGVSPPLNTSTITADDSLPLGRKILNESFNYPPLLCREEIDSEEQEDKEMRRLEESSFDSSAASPQSWTPSPPLGSKIDSLPPHIQISLPLGFTLPSHSSHVPELRFPTGATVFSFPKPTTRSEVAALLKRLQQHGRVSPIFRAHEEPSILQIRTRAMASKIRKAIQEMSGEKLFGDDPVPIDFDDKWSEEKQGYTFIISDLDIAFQASHSQKDESKESQNPANQMYILEELEQDLRLRGGFGDEGYENSIDYEESSNGIASEGSVPDDALLLQPRQFFYPHTNTPTSLDGMRASYFSQIFPSYERAWVEEVRRLERAYSRLRIQFLSLKREHFHCKSSPKALEGRSWHLEAKLEGCKRAREDANLRAIAAQRRLELIKNPLLAYQTPISEMQDRASRVDRLLQQVEEKHKPTDKTRLRGGGQRGTAEQRPTSQHGHHRTPKDCKPTQQEVKARGFIWHAALSTVIVSPSLHYQWARNTTLAQLRQILAYRAEHNIEDDMILRRIRHILEVRSQRSVPDPDTSQGQIVYIGLLDDPDCEYERSRAVQGEFPIWNFEGHSDDSSRDLDEEDWKMGLFHTFNVLRRHQARHGPESCVGSSTYGSADDEFPSFADVIIQLQGEVDSETGSYRSDKSFASPGMGSGNEDSDSFDIHHMDVRGYIKLMRFARDDPLYTTLLSADSPTSNYVLPFDMLEPLDPAQEFCAETEKDLVSNSASTLEERERDFEGAFPHDTMAQWFLCHERLCECRAKMETALEKKMKDTDPSNEPDSEDDDESIPTDAHSRSSSEGSNIEAPYPIKKIADNPSPDAEVSPSSLPNTENLAKSESTGVTSSPQPENPNIRGGGHDFDPNYSSSPVKLDLNSVFDCEGPSLPPHPEASPLTLSSTSPGFADSPCFYASIIIHQPLSLRMKPKRYINFGVHEFLHLSMMIMRMRNLVPLSTTISSKLQPRRTIRSNFVLNGKN